MTVSFTTYMYHCLCVMTVSCTTYCITIRMFHDHFFYDLLYHCWCFTTASFYDLLYHCWSFTTASFKTYCITAHVSWPFLVRPIVSLYTYVSRPLFHYFLFHDIYCFYSWPSTGVDISWLWRRRKVHKSECFTKFIPFFACIWPKKATDKQVKHFWIRFWCFYLDILTNNI